jgi:hypothetical protein
MRRRVLVHTPLLFGVFGAAACSAESRPTNTTSVSAPLDKAKPLAGLQPEPITIAPSAQFTAYNGLRTSLNGGATALDGGDKAKAADLLGTARTAYDKEFSATVKSSDSALHDKIMKSYDTMAEAIKSGDAGGYRYQRYFADIGILRLATLKTREALRKTDKAEAEKWFSTIANRFDLSKDIHSVGAAWKRVQNSPIDASTQKAVTLSLGSYLGTKVRAELKGAIGGMEEKNKAKARWETAGGIAFYDAIKEIYQEHLGADAAKKLNETILGVDTAIIAGDDAKAKTLIDQVNAQLDGFDKSIAG